ncbi:hypothetical protein [Leucobacter massiliensis]|nr:hypothetical protein [Leucobacter massiliensis]
MYMGNATKCACTPLIVMFVAAITAWKLSSVIWPFEVVIAVL